MSNINQEMLALERRYWDAVQHKDTEEAISLSDESCIVVGSQGVGAIDREQLGKMLQAASYELKTYAFDDKKFKVRQVADNVAIVAYPVREELIVDGQTTTLEAFDASVWVRRNGKWQCALHTESLKGDPFGRDRQPS
ncbi:MAG TPA: nuclear transport factor 2 family protein [Kofleriaceae bacterium]|nr:nuclear transport factor 2 family protein [Kofleriaceae bacterium]